MAYELLLQAGQSRCDVVRMGRQHIRGGMMSMARQKTGVPFNVQVMPRLQAAIDAMPASIHMTFLVTAQGKPFTAAGFGNYFRDCCHKAGLPSRCVSAKRLIEDADLPAGYTNSPQHAFLRRATNRVRDGKASDEGLSEKKLCPEMHFMRSSNGWSWS